MANVYRADIVGSLLRPQYLKLAREQYEAGHLAAAAYKEIEDRAVDQAIAMQEGAGLDVVSDGISEASRVFPREQLALSTQCGFASAGPGNAISEGAQENKLRLVGEVAARAWSS